MKTMLSLLATALVAATTLATDAEAQQQRRDRSGQTVAVVESSIRPARARIVDGEPEMVPIVSGPATEVVVDDIRPTNRVRFVPKRTFVYVSTDPYDHVH